MIDKLITFAKNWHTHNQDGHGFDHVFRVYKLAQSILSDYPMADQDIVLAAALLHDTYDEKLVDDVPAAKQQVAAFLTSISFQEQTRVDRKSTRLNSSHHSISYAVFCLK